MELKFTSIEEVQEFVKRLKGTRGGKDKDEGEAAGSAPAPMQPPAGGAMQGFNPGGSAGFVPPGAGAAPMGGAFPAAGAPQGPGPEIMALVQRITTRMDGALQSGATKADDMLTWFRSQCGPEAAQATLDQIKGHFLPRLGVPALENIAKLMGA